MLMIFFCHIAFCISTFAQQTNPDVQFNVVGFDIIGENPLNSDETDKILAPFLGEHQGMDRLLEAAARLEREIVLSGNSFHRVVLPQQTIEDGRINLDIIVFKLANINVSGNQHFSQENVKRSLPALESGAIPDTKELSRELILANDHPSKEVTLRIKQSDIVDRVDAELAVQDQRPWHIFAVLNNIGQDNTGNFRLSAGVQHSNLLNHDHSLTFSYTTSPDHTSEVKQYGFNYRIPVYLLSGNFSFFYSKSDVDSGTIQQVFDVSGAGEFSGGSYTHTFLNRGNYRHRATIGVDDKLFENNIDFQGTPIGTDVRTRPLTLSYAGEWRFPQASLQIDLSYIRNFTGGGLNKGSNFSATRFGAKQSWEALRINSNGNYILNNNWLISATLVGQYSNEPLISGEQFGLGGINSMACPLRTVPAIKLVFNLNWAHKEASHAKKTLQT